MEQRREGPKGIRRSENKENAPRPFFRRVKKEGEKMTFDEKLRLFVQAQSVLDTKSKFITKFRENAGQNIRTTKKVLREVTNVIEEVPDLECPPSTTKKIQQEETSTPPPAPILYSTLTYSGASQKKYQFPCFLDRDLKLPAHFASKTISHSCDNDCQTDDEQIKNAIRTVSRSLESVTREQRQIKKSLTA
eukprot:TRINITY_DN11417_c0_g2_i4.p1 TRINITY_DN11417_c0_g2~~TRINITY_DN11417_c0_g2_i4.p1  ORF type:complete len:191 (+),score=35.94 TRINITY_DN11417_c0_g2_i4:174-746(+)